MNPISARSSLSPSNKAGLRCGCLCGIVLGLLCSAVPVWSQVTEVVQGNGAPTVYRLTVSPAPAPEPAFRYRLLTHTDDRQAGNAAPFYYRALLGLDAVSAEVRKTYGEKYDQWYVAAETPLERLPKQEVRAAMQKYQQVMAPLREATARRYCDWDWDLHNVKGPQIYAFLLPEIQKCREVSRMLTIQTRLALAEGRFDDAVKYMQMTYRMGHDVATPHILVCGLVGIAISGQSNQGVLEWIACDQSPNLYWALAELPRPTVDLREATRFELSIGPRFFPALNAAETTGRTPQQWSHTLGDAITTLATTVGSGPMGGQQLPPPFDRPEWQATMSPLIGTGIALATYTMAKQALITGGMAQSDVEAMPVGQVITLQAARAYQHVSQQMETLWNMPFAEMVKRQPAVMAKLRADGYLHSGVPSKEILPIASMLLPAVQAARGAQVRLDRGVAALQLIEALRMHAATTGQLPKSLDEVTIVPVPNNPATGQPFVYSARTTGAGRAVAIIDLPETDGLRGDNRRYEITLRTSRPK